MRLNPALKLLMFMALLSTVLDSLWGQAADSIKIEIDPIVITGTRIEQNKSKVPSSLTIIDHATIDRSNTSNILPILSKQVPGFFLNNRNPVGYGVGPNSAGNISLRGVSGTPNTRILVLIDGQPQYMGIFGHPIADSYSSSDVERVEILRGPGSLLYGTNAMGGAINIITRSPKDENLHGTIRAALGSFNTQTYSGGLQYKKDKFVTSLAFNREKTHGFRKDARDEFVNNTGYWKGAYQLKEQIRISMDANISSSEYYHPGTTTSPLQNDKRSYLRGRGALSLENSFKKIEGALRVFYNFGAHDFSDGFNSTDFNRGVTFYQTLTYQLKNTLTIGFDYKNNGGNAENNALPPPARVGLMERHAIDEIQAYLLTQYFMGEAFSVNGGLRFVESNQFGSTVVPGIGITYQLAKHSSLKANVTKGFRSPTINDLFLFPPANSELLPESLWNYEIGFEKLFLEKTLQFDITAFLIEGSNLIQEVPNPMGPPTRRNTGAFSNKGVEFQSKYVPSSALSFLLSYSLLDVSTATLFAPRHNLNLQTTYRYKKIEAKLGLNQISDLQTSLADAEELEQYLLLDASVNLRLRPGLRFYINCDNLLNLEYEVEKGYAMPGIYVSGGIHFHF